MEVKVNENRVGGIGRVTVTVHDKKTDEEFECEFPWHKIIRVDSLKLMNAERVLTSKGEWIGWRGLYSPKTKDYPKGRLIRDDDLPKVCMCLQSDRGDLYLAPEGFPWR